jgi:hypothetical protein
VGVAELGVVGVGGEGLRRLAHVAQAPQVEDLEAEVVRPLAHHVGVVAVDLDVALHWPSPGHRQGAQVHRPLGIGDVDEGGPVRHAVDRDLAAGLRIGPAPSVAAPDRAEILQREHGQQVHVGAGVAGR